MCYSDSGIPVEFLKHANVGWLSLNMYPAEEEEEGEEGDPQPQTSPSGSSTEVFKVTCGRLEGNLHMNRFATGKQITLSRTWRQRGRAFSLTAAERSHTTRDSWEEHPHRGELADSDGVPEGGLG